MPLKFSQKQQAIKFKALDLISPAIFTTKSSLVPFALVLALGVATPAKGQIPYGGKLWDLEPKNDDPSRILQQSPLPISKPAEILPLARADWKETAQAHVITLYVPGVKREDIKIEVEDNRVLRIRGERKSEEERGVRAERNSCKFWRQFRMPASSDMDGIKAHLEDGVMKITVPKVVEAKRQPKVVNIVEESSEGDEIKASKTDV